MIDDRISQALHHCSVIADTHRHDLLREKAMEVLSIEPAHPLALMYLCCALNNLGAYEELERAARDGVRLHPEDPRFYYYLYLFHLHLGGSSYIYARNAICEAIRLAPSVARYHRELAEVYLINWEPEKARDCLLDAARLEPNAGEFRSRLALAELRCGNLNKAFELARSSLALSPDDHSVYNNAGQVFLFGGELDQAEQLFREALRRFPTYEYFQRQLINCEREKRDQKQRFVQKRRYTPLVLRQKGRKRFFDED